MKKVLVKGWVEDHTAHALTTKTQRHHSVPVRFKTEDGGYEWLWVRHNNVTPCRRPIAKSGEEGGKP